MYNDFLFNISLTLYSIAIVITVVMTVLLVGMGILYVGFVIGISLSHSIVVLYTANDSILQH